ncbi:MAG: hypothetical protein LLG06_04715 [Desulfobacteraceae bacterium]|nr:hypothetical protein [Desulfobacteraceae bacterium]
MKTLSGIGAAVFFLALIFCFQVPECPAGEAQGVEAGLEQTPSPTQGDCHAVLSALDAQKAVFQRELGQIKRELAAMRQDMTRPGLRDVLAGIGYIFGMAGVALYALSRKSAKGGEHAPDSVS